MDNKFIKFLDKKLGRVLPEYKEKYLEMFKELGFNHNNEDFVEFWSNYNDEIPAKDGFLPPFGDQILDFENSVTQNLRLNSGITDNIYSLFNFEFDDYMFYDKDTDEVFLVLAPNLKEFVDNHYYDKKWNSFIDFIKDQLHYPK